MSATKGIPRVQGKRGDLQLQLRLPGNLRDRIKSNANASGHSMNTAIIMVLEEAFPSPAEPESINEALLQAANDIARQWSTLLGAMGQDPSDNAALQTIQRRLAEAEARHGPST